MVVDLLDNLYKLQQSLTNSVKCFERLSSLTKTQAVMFDSLTKSILSILQLQQQQRSEHPPPQSGHPVVSQCDPHTVYYTDTTDDSTTTTTTDNPPLTLFDMCSDDKKKTGGEAMFTRTNYGKRERGGTSRPRCDENRVHLNVGGSMFHTTQTTLLSEKNTFFTSLIDFHTSCWPSSHENENSTQGSGNGPPPQEPIFIDRSPLLFDHILNYLRYFGGIADKRALKQHGITEWKNSMTTNEQYWLRREAKFYGIESLLNVFNSFDGLLQWDTEHDARLQLSQNDTKLVGMKDCFPRFITVKHWDTTVKKWTIQVQGLLRNTYWGGVGFGYPGYSKDPDLHVELSSRGVVFVDIGRFSQKLCTWGLSDITFTFAYNHTTREIRITAHSDDKGDGHQYNATVPPPGDGASPYFSVPRPWIHVSPNYSGEYTITEQAH